MVVAVSLALEGRHAVVIRIVGTDRDLAVPADRSQPRQARTRRPAAIAAQQAGGDHRLVDPGPGVHVAAVDPAEFDQVVAGLRLQPVGQGGRGDEGLLQLDAVLGRGGDVGLSGEIGIDHPGQAQLGRLQGEAAPVGIVPAALQTLQLGVGRGRCTGRTDDRQRDVHQVQTWRDVLCRLGRRRLR